ncbi:MAG: PilW family protein [Cardiobacteriaceae bacterium]|nr:PilW family protein [Cardiobacteriaceae bacterium]
MYRNKQKQQGGLSLLELLVSLSIGLILLLALASLMITANRSAQQRSTSEAMDEQARQVFSLLETDLYRAGFLDPFTDEQTILSVFNLNNVQTLAGYTRQAENINDPARATPLGRRTEGRILPLQGFDGTASAPAPAGMTCTAERQCIQVAYQAVAFQQAIPGSGAGSSTTPAPVASFSSVASIAQEEGSLSGAALGCNGVQAKHTHPIIVNQYQVGIATGEKYSSLRCDSSSRNFKNEDGGGKDAAQPVVSGVEQLTFRYLVTPPDNTGKDERVDLSKTISGRSVTGLKTAGEVATVDATSNPLRWAAVVGVEICTVVAAQPADGSKEIDIPTVQPNVPTCIKDDKGVWTEKKRTDGDTRVHRRYVRTINLPNALHLTN